MNPFLADLATPAVLLAGGAVVAAASRADARLAKHAQTRARAAVGYRPQPGPDDNARPLTRHERRVWRHAIADYYLEHHR